MRRNISALIFGMTSSKMIDKFVLDCMCVYVCVYVCVCTCGVCVCEEASDLKRVTSYLMSGFKISEQVCAVREIQRQVGVCVCASMCVINIIIGV